MLHNCSTMSSRISNLHERILHTLLTILCAISLQWHNVVVGTIECPVTCQCTVIQTGPNNTTGKSMECLIPNSLDAIPQITTGAETLLDIIIHNQPRLTHLHRFMLQNYTNLEMLEIESTGLTYISDDSFQHNSKIKQLHLKDNRIKRFHRRLISHLDKPKLLLDRNPLACNCSNIWLGLSESIVQVLEVAPNVTCQRDANDQVWGTQNASSNWVTEYEDNTYDIVEFASNLADDCHPPKVSVNPQRQEAQEGTRMNFTCCMDSQGLADLRWINVDALMSSVQIVKESENVSQLQLLVNVSDHYKMVMCRAYNDVGTSDASARIIVPNAPVVKDMILYQKFDTRIFFKIAGWPRPRITWYKDGRVSVSIPHIVDTFPDKPNDQGHWRGMRQFKDVLPSIAGTYTLVAENLKGTSNCSIELPDLSVPRDKDRIDLRIPNIIEGVDPLVPQNHSKVHNRGELNSTRLSTNTVEESHDLLIIIISSVIVGALIIFAIVLAMYLFRHRKRNSRVKGRCDRKLPFTSQKHDDFREAIPLTGGLVVENPNYETRLKKGNKLKSSGLRHIQLETILLMQKIGEGAFGQVLLGKCAHLFKKNVFTNVAVKTLKGDCKEEIKKDFEREAELLATIHHPNIVTFFGVCTEGEQWMMLFEFMEYGDLNNFLRTYGPHSAMLRPHLQNGQKNEILSITQLLNIVLQISKGMEYLTSQHFVHRDLATRNCLVGESHVVKIGDFGMSKDVYSTDYYKVGDTAMLPVRWMPPESIMYRTFTVKSDVWSFGITLWEVFTYGTQPWFEYSNLEVIEKIKNCRHLSKPSYSTDGVYNIMLGCWKTNPSDRLTMKEINMQLKLEKTLLQPEYLDVIG